LDDYAASLKDAVDCFIARRERAEHPDGVFRESPEGTVWAISATERQPCCASAKPSDLGGRQKFIGHWLNQHCRTIAHVANLHGVSENDLRKALKAKPVSAGQLKLF
jgi:hypothetical protein